MSAPYVGRYRAADACMHGLVFEGRTKVQYDGKQERREIERAMEWLSRQAAGPEAKR